MSGEQPIYGSPWSKDELILALYLYCQIPFARTKVSNKEVIRLAKLLGRTPSSVARKLGNFGAFDPLLAERAIGGLPHASKLDRQVWNEFLGQWDNLVRESRRLLELKKADFVEPSEQAPIISLPEGPTEKAATVLVRLYQSFFRKTVLAGYEYCCCVCGIDLPQLLIASHIVPWAARADLRTVPENGLCLCAIHDRAFDRGLIGLNDAYEIVISSVARQTKSAIMKHVLFDFEGAPITMPTRFAPSSEYLQWHLDHIFEN